MNRTVLELVEAEYRRYRLLGERAMYQLEPGERLERSGQGNSIATIVWHVAGNLESRFTDFLTTDGEKPWRNRDAEFEVRDASAAEVVKKPTVSATQASVGPISPFAGEKLERGAMASTASSRASCPELLATRCCCTTPFSSTRK